MARCGNEHHSRQNHSGREDSHSRFTGTGFSVTGCLGKEAAKQSSRVYLRVKLNTCLECVAEGVSVFKMLGKFDLSLYKGVIHPGIQPGSLSKQNQRVVNAQSELVQ